MGARADCEAVRHEHEACRARRTENMALLLTEFHDPEAVAHNIQRDLNAEEGRMRRLLALVGPPTPPEHIRFAGRLIERQTGFSAQRDAIEDVLALIRAERDACERERREQAESSRVVSQQRAEAHSVRLRKRRSET